MRHLVGVVTIIVGMFSGSKSHAAVVASMEGAVELAGTTPTLEQLAIRGDRFCTDCASGSTIPDESLVINPNGTIQGAIVYIKSGLSEEVKTRLTTGTVHMTTKCCRFSPRILAARVGQEMIVSNADQTVHNFNTRSPNNPRSNTMLKPVNGGSEVVNRTFTKPDLPVRIQCDIHPWMVGYVGVFDHPYFTVTDNTGKFRFENLPPGEYKVGVWHETLGEQEKEATLGGGGVPTKVEFRLFAK